MDGGHTLADFYEGIQMGIIFNLYQCYEVLCEENRRPEKIIVSGGITNSTHWTQMAADIFEQDILVADFSNASLMGAAALALHAAGVLNDINSFKTEFESARIVSCEKEHSDYYKKHYSRYMKAYQEAAKI